MKISLLLFSSIYCRPVLEDLIAVGKVVVNQDVYMEKLPILSSELSNPGPKPASLLSLTSSVSGEESFGEAVYKEGKLVSNSAAIVASKATFKAEEAALEAAQILPIKNSDAIRLLTYNVEALKDKEGIYRTIEKSSPDVFVLQEVPGSALKQSSEFHQKMLSMGYKEKMDCKTFRSLGVVGNVIYSKYPIGPSNVYALSDRFGNRCLIEAVITTPMGTILIFGTHLSNKLATEREIQLNGLSTLSQLRSKQGFTHQILFGDLNSKKSDVERLTSSAFVDSFDFANQPSPSRSQWRGNRIDYILLSKDMPAPSTRANSLSVHSPSSDHNPIMLDLTLQGSLISNPLPKQNEIFPKPKGLLSFII